jgi:6-phosphogluconolactonase (cycloisomerase 2 family)
VFALDEKGERVTHRTHGAGMTPNEKELWISDQKGNRLFIFDLTTMPPAAAGQVDLSAGGHGWVCFSRDGKYAWCHTPDVFDVETRERVAVLKDEEGKPFSSSKFLEVHFRGDEVVWVGNEFGLGRVEEE